MFCIEYTISKITMKFLINFESKILQILTRTFETFLKTPHISLSMPLLASNYICSYVKKHFFRLMIYNVYNV